MLDKMHRNRSVDVHQFAMVPRAEIPRSRFNKPHAHKTTFQAGYLIPIYIDEVLPGDTHELTATLFARLSTPIYPIMDNLYMESFWFFVPQRLLWLNYDRFFGAQDNPADSTSYTIPVTTNITGGPAAFSLYDYFGIPTNGQIPGGSNISVNVLPLRAYNLIWNLWFRDENLQNAVGYGSTGGTNWTAMDNGPDPYGNYVLLKRGKRHDYFTACLPWTQKGGTVLLPLSGTAAVKGVGWTHTGSVATGGPTTGVFESGGASRTYTNSATLGALGGVSPMYFEVTTNNLNTGAPTIYADLSTATATTINSLRLAFATQKVLERDARGGTRYQEKIFAHFGVMGSDARLQRPEYLGGSKQPINIQPIPQTGPTGTTGSTSPMGTLAAYGQITMHGAAFRQSFTEHGFIIGLVSVTADLTYQQGLRRLWTRSTQYDFYLPAFAHLGEQAVRNDEIYCTGSVNGAQDATAFGYQERWAEMRYMPSMITGAFRSTYTTPLDSWHLAEKFSALPTLSAAFIQSSTDATVRRAIAAAAAADNEQLIFDAYFQNQCTRAMPLYSVPGFIDRF